jgi:hypothetical protein
VYLVAGDRAIGAGQRAAAVEVPLDGRDDFVGCKPRLDRHEPGTGYLAGVAGRLEGGVRQPLAEQLVAATEADDEALEGPWLLEETRLAG